jgi:cytochrome c oxidase subunit 1
MLIAALFAGLAGLLAMLSLVVAGRQLPSLDLYFHATYFVLAPKHLELFVALTCGIFAGIYFVFSKWVPTHFNQTAGLLHFIVFVLAIVLGILGVHSYSVSTTDAATRLSRLSHLFTAAALCFSAGCAVFVVNCLLVLFGMIRLRFSSR